MSTNAHLLKSIDGGGGSLPVEIVDNVFKQVTEKSTVLSVAGSVPVPLTGGAVAVPTGEVVAGVVGEGDEKPIVKGGVKFKTMKPIKIAAIMYWSRELRRRNPAAVIPMFEAGLVNALQLAIDMAAIHGRDALTGDIIPGVEYLTQSAHTVDLGTTAQKDGGLYGDIVKGYGLVTDGGRDFSGFIADPRMRTQLMSATDLQGRPLGAVGVDLSSPLSTVLGLPAAYGKAVSGRVGGSTDTGIRAIGGDFSESLKIGYVADSVTFRRTDVATLVDGGEVVSLFQRNLEATLVEAEIGWVIRDVDDYAIYRDPAVTPQEP